MSQSGRRLIVALMLASVLFALVISPASSNQRQESAFVDHELALIQVPAPALDDEPGMDAGDSQEAGEESPALEPIDSIVPEAVAAPAAPPPPVEPRRSVPQPPPRPAVIKPSAPSRTSSASSAGYRTVRMRVTAYCPCKYCCGPKAKGITASGKTVRANGSKFVAADTRMLPFNTKISIPGYNNGAPVPVLDTGSAIKGNRLDVYFHSHSVAKNWGSRWLTCRVYKK